MFQYGAVYPDFSGLVVAVTCTTCTPLYTAGHTTIPHNMPRSLDHATDAKRPISRIPSGMRSGKESPTPTSDLGSTATGPADSSAFDKELSAITAPSHASCGSARSARVKANISSPLILRHRDYLSKRRKEELGEGSARSPSSSTTTGYEIRAFTTREGGSGGFDVLLRS